MTVAMAACSSEAPAPSIVSSAVERDTSLVFRSDFNRSANLGVVTDETGNQDGRISTDAVGELSGASWTTRENGGGDALEITRGHVEVAATPALNAIREGVTLCARVRARGTSPGWGAIVTRQEVSQDAPSPGWHETYGLYVHGSGVRFVTSAAETLTLDTPVTLDAWVHLCATYDGTTKRAVGYTNCAPDGAAALQGTLNNQTNNPLIIGGNHNFGADHPVDENFPGAIDDVRVYNRALSAAEVAQLCAPARVCAPGAACCHLPDGGDGSAVDGAAVDAGAGAVGHCEAEAGPPPPPPPPPCTPLGQPPGPSGCCPGPFVHVGSYSGTCTDCGESSDPPVEIGQACCPGTVLSTSSTRWCMIRIRP